MKSGVRTKAELFRRVALISVLLTVIGCGGAALDPSELQPVADEAQISSSEESLAAMGLPDGFVRIAPRHSWQCLDLDHGSYNPSAHFIQSPCHAGDNQRFLIEDLGNGYHRVRVKHSGQCLDLDHGSYNPSAHFIQSPCHAGDNQQFLIQHLGNGYHRVRVKHSGQCLDLEGGSYTPSAHFIQSPCHGGDNQQFRIE